MYTKKTTPLLLLPVVLAAVLTACRNTAPISEATADTAVTAEITESVQTTEQPPPVSAVQEYAPGVTGAPEFTVQRPTEDGKTVSSAKYIAETNTGEANTAGMAKLLSDIAKYNMTSREKVTKVEIPAGTYRFGGEAANTIHLSGLSNLVIEGNGSLFLFEEHETYSQGSFFRIENCRTLELRNLSVDWDWEQYPLFVIGEVVSSDISRNSVRFRVDSHSLPEDMTFHLTFGLGRTWNPAIDNRSESVGFVQSGTPRSVTRISEHEIEVVYSTDKSARSAKAGQQFQFYFQPNHNASAFRLQSNQNLTFSNVTIHSAPYEAVNSLDSEYLQFLSCKVVPGEGRRFSTYGGLEIHAVRGYFRLEDSTLEGICDDNLHLSNHYFGGANVQVDEYTVRLTELQTWSSKDYIYEGAAMELRDSQFAGKGWSSVITSFETIYDENAPTSNKTTYVVTFRDPLPEDFKPTDKFFNTDFYTGGYVIKNNTFRGGLAHAMYIGLPNGTIENNTAENFAYPSLIVNTVQRWTRWYIGTPIDNVVIRGNTFTKCNTSQRDPASVAICAGKDGQPTDYYPAQSRVVTNILFENNLIENSTGSALAVFSAENVYIRGNRFLNSNTLPTTKNRWKNWGSVWVTEAEDVYLEGNTIENPAGAYEHGLYIDPKTTEHIVVDGVEQ